MAPIGRLRAVAARGGLPPPMCRRLRAWHRPAAVVLILALVGAGFLVRDPMLRLGARSLVHEWTRCAVRGEAPAPQPGIAAAAQAHQRAQRPPTRAPADPLVLPVVRPRAQVRSTVSPSGDRHLGPPRRVVVAVIDSGVTAQHSDVQAEHVLPGVDLLNPCGDGRQDVTGHGTAVAGVLLSNHHGAAPRVDVLPVRISMATGRHSTLTSALAIVTATRRGADIINMSYTSQGTRASFFEALAVRYATARGVALVAAAGNEPAKPAGFPAAYPQVLSVTALDGRGELSDYAARTGRIDVAAPGSRVITLASDGSMRVASGTSLAAPLVSASLVHMLRADPSVSPQVVVETVRATSAPEPDLALAERFGAFNFHAALAGVCAISSACQLTAALQTSPAPTAPPIGDPDRLPRPGEPR